MNNGSDIKIDGLPIDEFIDNNVNLKITIANSNLSEDTDNSNFIGEAANQDITITLQDGNDRMISDFERPQTLLTIFDSQYYLDRNPDVAENVENKFQNVTYNLGDLSFPGVPAPSLYSNTNSQDQDTLLPFFVGGIEHYVETGASEGRDPSPLFDSQYYLEANPQVASALAGGDFAGDPLLHYVETGASAGLDPNPYFDSSFYTQQNPEVSEQGFNPLEHYVLFGSSARLDPSPDFDSSFYLEQNLDVANAGIDPLTHFLVFGQQEGRDPIAE